jgi:hypothetical protein
MKETDLLESHPRRLMPAWAHGRSLISVRALLARPDARSRPRWKRRLLIAGDAALALALAALAVASRAPGDGPRIGAVGIIFALLQTLPLAFRRWRPVWVLARVVAATLGTAIAATLGTAIAGDAHVAGPVCVLVALLLGGRPLPAAGGGLGGHRLRGRPGLAALARQQR